MQSQNLNAYILHLAPVFDENNLQQQTQKTFSSGLGLILSVFLSLIIGILLASFIATALNLKNFIKTGVQKSRFTSSSDEQTVEV